MVGVAAAVVKNYVRVLVGGEGDVVGKLVDHTWRQSLEARSRPGMDFVQVGGRSFCVAVPFTCLSSFCFF